MFSQAEMDRLIDAMHANGVTSLEVESDDHQLKLELETTAFAAPQMAAPQAAAPREQLAKSPCIGRFMGRGVEDGLAPLAPSAPVTAGDTLGYIAHGTSLALITAPCDGILINEIPQDGTIFGHGDSVFRVEVTA